MSTSANAVRVSKMRRFCDRVNFFVVKCAAAVMLEDVGTAGYPERVIFSGKVMVNDYNLPQYVNAVLTNGTVLSNLTDDVDADNGISDGDLEFTVNSFYNAFAGVAT